MVEWLRDGALSSFIWWWCYLGDDSTQLNTGRQPVSMIIRDQVSLFNPNWCQSKHCTHDPPFPTPPLNCCLLQSYQANHQISPTKEPKQLFVAISATGWGCPSARMGDGRKGMPDYGSWYSVNFSTATLNIEGSIGYIIIHFFLALPHIIFADCIFDIL